MRFIYAASLAGLAHAQNAGLEELVDNGLWGQASALADQRLKSGAATDAKLQWLAARVRFAYGDLDKAAELAEKAAAVDPKNADYQFFLFEVYGSQAEKASLLRQPGLAHKCKKAVDNAIALDPRHIEALIGSMLYLYQAPGFFGGDKKRALAIPGEIGKFNPARGHLAQARLELLEKQSAKARECYRKAVAADPELQAARVLLSRSLAYDDAPDLAQAETHAREAIRINPKRIDGWDALAYALGRQGKTAELDKAIARMDEPTGAYHGARGLLDGGKDLAKAEQLFRQYLKQPAAGPERPSAAVAHLNLAMALEKLGRKTEAVTELEAAARLNPKHPGIQKELKRLRG